MSLLLGSLAVYVGLALYLYVIQGRLIYYPNLPSREVTATPADIGLPYESLKLKTADGETLDAWFVPAAEPRGTLLYFYGNGGNIGHRLDPIDVFHKLGLNVLIFDYRGYGASTGKPDELGTYEDALAAWNYLTVTRGILAQKIILFGESLGGAVGTWLAVRHKPAALITYATITSVADMAQQLYPFLPARLLVRYRYDTRRELANVRCPVLIMHSIEDEIIPFSHGQALFEAANEPKHFLELRGGHNEALLVSREIYARGVDEFLRELR